MDVSKEIAELLMRCDYIIIPGFGTINSEEKFSAVHPVQHSFEPPRKNFSFSNVPATDDRVLIDAILKKEDGSKDFAAKAVRDFIAEIKTSLKEKGAYELKGIGKFYLDVEKKLQFTSQPDKNYLLSSFGLPEFISKPVLHPENVQTYSSPPLKKVKKKRRRFIWFRF